MYRNTKVNTAICTTNPKVVGQPSLLLIATFTIRFNKLFTIMYVYGLNTKMAIITVYRVYFHLSLVPGLFALQSLHCLQSQSHLHSWLGVASLECCNGSILCILVAYIYSLLVIHKKDINPSVLFIPRGLYGCWLYGMGSAGWEQRDGCCLLTLERNKGQNRI